MKRKLFIAIGLIAISSLFAFGIQKKSIKTKDLPSGCPCPTVTFSYGGSFMSDIASCCAPPPPGSGIVKTYPKLQVYDCNHSLTDWIDLCPFPASAQLPCLGGDCGGGCPAGLYLNGFDMQLPAAGSSVVYTSPGNSCFCDGQNLAVTITNTSGNIHIDFSCI